MANARYPNIITCVDLFFCSLLPFWFSPVLLQKYISTVRTNDQLEILMAGDIGGGDGGGGGGGGDCGAVLFNDIFNNIEYHRDTTDRIPHMFDERTSVGHLLSSARSCIIIII